jgi:hypothetical protein
MPLALGILLFVLPCGSSEPILRSPPHAALLTPGRVARFYALASINRDRTYGSAEWKLARISRPGLLPLTATPVVHDVRSADEAILLSGRCPADVSSQHGEPSWPAGLTPEDREAIVELTQQLGIGRLQTIVAFNLDYPEACPHVRVESMPAVDGDRVLSQLLWLRRERGPGCSRFRPPVRATRRGNWITGGDPRPVQRWRFRHDDWHVDVLLDEGVRYADAARIVHAIRRKSLVDRRDSDDPRPAPLSVDAARIIRISQDRRQSSKSTGADQQFNVAFSTHDWFRVKVVDGSVELHGWGQWQS